MRNKRVILISSGLLTPKKEDNHLNRCNLYPNYGLISLATTLKNKGYSPVIIHGDYEPPKVILDLMSEYGVSTCETPILLSLPSFFSVKWAQIFCEEFKKKLPTKKIILGGKWVVSGNELWIKDKIPEVDYVISGNAENVIEDLLYCRKSNFHTNLTLPKHLDYTTVHDFKKYQPSIEVARGCGQGCLFCLEKESPYILVSTPKKVIHSILQHQKDYQSTSIMPYLQASFFNPTLNWCKTFYSYYHKYNLSVQWRTQTRVDSMSVKKIEILSKAGLKVLDLGLESASAEQLVTMGKSKNPNKYLRQASKFLRKCYEKSIWCKVNILFYPGETPTTIQETFNWLVSHKKHIKGISINPLYIYRCRDVNGFVDSLKQFGANLVSEKSLDEFGYAHLNLSDSINFDEAIKISLKIRNKIVKDVDYFDLKSFSYFNRFYSFDNFQKDLNNVGDTLLPFHRTTE